MRRVCRSLLSVLTTTLVVLLVTAPAGRADPPVPPSEVTLTGPSSDLTAPASFTLQAAETPGTWYWVYRVVVVDDDTGQDIGGCSYDTHCEVGGSFGFVDDATTRHFHAEARDQSGAVVAQSGSIAVTADPPDWKVDLGMDSDTVTMPGRATLSATLSPGQWTPYELDIINTGTGDVVKGCAAAGGDCSVFVGGGYLNDYSVDGSYKVVLKNTTTGRVLASSQEKVVTFLQAPWSIAVSGPRLMAPHTSGEFDINDMPHQWSPYQQQLVDADDDSVIKPCGTDYECGTMIYSGDAGSSRRLYARVIDTTTGVVLARSPVFTVATIDIDTATSIDGLSIAGLAGAFGSATQLCNYILNFPGTHRAEASVSDEWLGCDGVAQAGGSSEAALRAALSATIGFAGAGALAWWLEHEWWTSYPANPPTAPPATHPPSPPATAPPAIADALDTLTADLLAKNPALTQELAEAVARGCLWEGSAAARFAADYCKRVPIFVSGSNVSEASQHDLDAITANPQWAALTTAGTGNEPAREQWYRDLPECADASEPLGLDCDEYPFRSTAQGGPGASLKVISASHNRSQGTSLGNFYKKCGMRDADRIIGGDPFLVVPIPDPIGPLPIPTMAVCNGWALPVGP
jgi:hypothetical protein